jgi:hypothetical protein
VDFVIEINNCFLAANNVHDAIHLKRRLLKKLGLKKISHRKPNAGYKNIQAELGISTSISSVIGRWVSVLIQSPCQ